MTVGYIVARPTLMMLAFTALRALRRTLINMSLGSIAYLIGAFEGGLVYSGTIYC